MSMSSTAIAYHRNLEAPAGYLLDTILLLDLFDLRDAEQGLLCAHSSRIVMIHGGVVDSTTHFSWKNINLSDTTPNIANLSRGASLDDHFHYSGKNLNDHHGSQDNRASKMMQERGTGPYQQTFRETGLAQTGKIPELLQRLKEPRVPSKNLPDDLDDMCDAILSDACHALEQALKVEEHNVHEVGGKVYVGNPQGLSLAGLPERLRIQEEQNTRSKDKIATNTAQIAALKAKIAELSDYITVLRLARPDQ
ncbi:hypothetical protein HOY82DRAFT_615818 [Tuber indicum]|nr:hypothetical protein HOY82DRAFT_615818 [Tuber indicum]